MPPPLMKDNSFKAGCFFFLLIIPSNMLNHSLQWVLYNILVFSVYTFSISVVYRVMTDKMINEINRNSI